LILWCPIAGLSLSDITEANDAINHVQQAIERPRKLEVRGSSYTKIDEKTKSRLKVFE
jgi:hypothetical protein